MIILVICCKRVTTTCRRSMKGKRNEMQRQKLERELTENDYICTKCILEHQRGHLKKKATTPWMFIVPGSWHFFIWEAIQTKIVAFVILKKNHLKLISDEARTNVLLRHSIIFPDKARACFSHMSSDRKQILDSEVAKFSQRMRHKVSKVSSSLLT